MRRDLICGVAVLVLAVAYYAAATALPESMLSDETGADGVPRLLAIVLGALGALVAIRAVLGMRPSRSPAGSTASGDPRPNETAAGHLRAGGLVLIGIVFVVVAPWLGYLIATVTLIFCVAVYSGQRPSLTLAAISLGGGAALWVAFVKLLGVAMPAGLIFAGTSFARLIPA